MSAAFRCPHCGNALERLSELVAQPTTPPRPDVEERVLDELAAGPLSADDVQRKVRRRRKVVRDALQALGQSGQAVKDASGLWSLPGRSEPPAALEAVEPPGRDAEQQGTDGNGIPDAPPGPQPIDFDALAAWKPYGGGAE